MTIQKLLTDIDSKFKVGSANDYENLYTKLIADPFATKTGDPNIKIYTESDNKGDIKLYYNDNTPENTFNNDIDGLVELLDTKLLTNPIIPKLDYKNTDIIKNYEILRNINTSITKHKDLEKITRNDIDKTKNNIDLQYYEIIIIIILLIIIIIITGILNLNDKKPYVKKYIIPALFLLFLITYIFNSLFIQIEPFSVTPNLYGFDIFKVNAIITGTKNYNAKIETLPSVNNYYDVYYHLTDNDIKTDTKNEALNKLVTKYTIIDMLYNFNNKNTNASKKYISTSHYISEIDKNLKQEVKKSISANNVIKSSEKNSKEYYNDIYRKSLYYNDVVYLLIYITLISTLLNAIIIDFGYNRMFVGLYIFLFILGILVYSYRYLIRTRTNPSNRYF